MQKVNRNIEGRIFEKESNLKLNETISTYDLYILRPSIITDVQGEFLTEDDNEYVKQKITFVSLPGQVVIAQTNMFNSNRYADVFRKENSLTPHNAYDIYFNQEKLVNEGLRCQHKKARFVGIFPEDVLTLSDFNFIQKLGDINLIKKLVYFNRPFSEYDRALKEKFHNRNKIPKEISLRDLQIIRESLMARSEEDSPMTRTIEYKVIREPLNQKSSLHFVRDGYAGTTEDEEVKNQKILLRKLP